MKINYRYNLSAGCFSIILSIILFLIIPSQIQMETQSVHGITSRTLPYALAVLIAVCGVILIIQSLVLKKDEIKTIEIKKEFIGLLYMIVLLLYSVAFSYSFLISTSALGIITLAFLGCKKKLYYAIIVFAVFLLYFVFTGLLNVRLP